MSSRSALILVLLVAAADALLIRSIPSKALDFRERSADALAHTRMLDGLMKIAKFEEPTASAIMLATAPTVAEEDCGSFDKSASSGGGAYYVWCKDPMEKVSRGTDSPKGLSYGVYTWDTWSEGLGNRYHVPTDLYDCFSTSKNTKAIKQYQTPYTRHDTCLGGKKERKEDKAAGMHDFETIDMHLEGRKPLSTFVKIDIEGDEWPVLTELLKKTKDLEKIASLDFEFHFCALVAGDHPPLQLLNGLLDNFSVTGRWPGEASADLEKKACKGYPAQMISVSYINKHLLP